MPNFGELLFALPDELKNLYRNLERVSRKLIMSNWSLKFNRTCLLEDILPKYSDNLLLSFNFIVFHLLYKNAL